MCKNYIFHSSKKQCLTEWTFFQITKERISHTFSENHLKYFAYLEKNLHNKYIVNLNLVNLLNFSITDSTKHNFIFLCLISMFNIFFNFVTYKNMTQITTNINHKNNSNNSQMIRYNSNNSRTICYNFRHEVSKKFSL